MCFRWAAAIILLSLLFHLPPSLLTWSCRCWMWGLMSHSWLSWRVFLRTGRAVVASRHSQPGSSCRSPWTLGSSAFFSGQMHLEGKSWGLVPKLENYLLQRKMIEGVGIAVLASDSVFHLGTGSCHPPASEKYLVSKYFFRIQLLGG